MTINVYQHCDSNEIWAINLERSKDHTYTVWKGELGKTLIRERIQAKPSDDHTMFISSLEEDILANWYFIRDDITVDVETDSVIGEGIPRVEKQCVSSDEKFFYFSFTLPAISSKISELLVHVETYLLQVEMNLMELRNEALLIEYKRSSVYRTLKEFQRDKALGDVPFSDGPLAFLVLFGLRRYLENKGDDTMALTFVEETGQWVTDKFSDHHTVIDELFQRVADSTSVQKADAYKNKLAQEYLCIEKPVDFSALQSDTSASYF